jgi:hypothetical protein
VTRQQSKKKLARAAAREQELKKLKAQRESVAASLRVVRAKLECVEKEVDTLKHSLAQNGTYQPHALVFAVPSSLLMRLIVTQIKACTSRGTALKDWKSGPLRWPLSIKKHSPTRWWSRNTSTGSVNCSRVLTGTPFVVATHCW